MCDRLNKEAHVTLFQRAAHLKEVIMRLSGVLVAFLLMASLLLAAFPASAQTPVSPTAVAPGPVPPQTVGSANVVRASDLLSYSVKNSKGDNLGKVVDALVLLKTGNILYIVMSFGGIAGIGDKLVPVPWNAEIVKPYQGNLIMDVDPNQIKNAPNFGSDQWPNSTANGWDAPIAKYWSEAGVQASAAPTQAPQPAVTPGTQLTVEVPQAERLSRLLTFKVKNSKGDDLGGVKNAVIQWRTGNVQFLVLAFGGSLFKSNKLYAIPWQAFSLDALNQSFVIDITPDKLAQAPGFDPSNWPDTARPEWDSPYVQYWGSSGFVGGPGPISGQGSLRASQLLGLPVQDQNGKEVGKLEDMLIQLGERALVYAVISLPNGGDNVYPIPIVGPTLQWNADKKAVILNVDSGLLDKAPGFNKNAYPDLNDPKWNEKIHAFWAGSSTPMISDSLRTATTYGLQRVSTMLGKGKIQSADGQDAGTIADAVVNLNQATVPYVVLSFENKLFGVPTYSLNWDAGKSAWVVDATLDKLRKAPSFTNDNGPISAPASGILAFDSTGTCWAADCPRSTGPGSAVLRALGRSPTGCIVRWQLGTSGGRAPSADATGVDQGRRAYAGPCTALRYLSLSAATPGSSRSMTITYGRLRRGEPRPGCSVSGR